MAMTSLIMTRRGFGDDTVGGGANIKNLSDAIKNLYWKKNG